MSTREHRFDVPGTPRLAVRMPVGEVRIVEGDTGEVVIQLDGRDSAVSRFIVEQRGGDIVVEPERSSLGWRSSVTLTVMVGAPPRLHARLTAADLEVSVPLDSLVVETASGNVVVGDVTGDVDVRTASGDVKVGAVSGRLDIASASGDVRVESVAGMVSAKTASGDLTLGSAAEDVGVKSASGDVAVGRFTGSWLDVKTMSGDTSVGVTSGRRFDVTFQTLSGRVRTDFPVAEGSSAPGSDARLAVKSMSGNIEIHAARE